MRALRALLTGAVMLSAALATGSSRAEDAATPQHGGTLTYLLAADPSYLVAFSPDSSQFVGPLTTEGLLTYDQDLNPRPLLATSWDISADGKTYTFHLRDGVKWHDGQPFTSADVATSIDIIRKIHPRGRNTFANVVEVQTPDPLTAVIVLDKPAPYLLSALAAGETPIVPKHIYDGTDPTKNPNNAAPIGTGAFRFKEWVRGDHITFERNPDYWGGPRPWLDRVIVRIVADPAARAVLFETGEADMGAGGLVALSDVERLTALPHLQLVRQGTVFSAGVKRIEFNLDEPHFANLKVRQAVAHALDRNFIRDVVWYGYGQIISGPVSPEVTRFYVPDLPDYPFDTDAAEKLLDEAGYPRGADGTRFAITLDFRPATEGDRRTADYVKQALAKVGIAVTVRTQDFASYVKRVYTDRDFAFTVNSMTNTFDPTIGIQRLYWSKNFQPGVPFSNGAHYDNPEVDRLYEAAAVEVDPQKRKELFTEAFRITATELPDINFLSDDAFNLVNRRVRDPILAPDGTISSGFADIWIDKTAE